MTSTEHSSVEETMCLLGHPRRRLIIQYFNQKSNPITVRELAARVARWEQDGMTEPPATEVDRVEGTLVETHLPMMVKRKWVTSDDEYTEVRYDGDSIALSLRNTCNVMGFLWRDDHHENS